MTFRRPETNRGDGQGVLVLICCDKSEDVSHYGRFTSYSFCLENWTPLGQCKEWLLRYHRLVVANFPLLHWCHCLFYIPQRTAPTTSDCTDLITWCWSKTGTKKGQHLCKQYQLRRTRHFRSLFCIVDAYYNCNTQSMIVNNRDGVTSIPWLVKCLSSIRTKLQNRRQSLHLAIRVKSLSQLGTLRYEEPFA